MKPHSKTPASRRTASKAASSKSNPAGVVTLEMVAQQAGVSPSTVSRILNGTATVSPDKKVAVDAAIKKLGFRPNPVARGLAGGRTMSVGVLTQTISSPFYGEALLGIEDELERAGYIPLFVSGHWTEGEERNAIEALLSRRVDALIVLAGRLSNTALQAYAKRLPMVVVGREVKGPRLFSLSFENRQGGVLATQHLIECGHTRIAFIAGDPGHEDALEREAGYRQALEQAGLAFDPGLVMPGDFTEAGGLMAVNRLLDSRAPFTAIFASNDQAAIGAALGLYRRNVRVPDDVSLVGFDDVAPARFAIPPLTTVRQSVYETGAQAALAALELLRGNTPVATLPAPTLVPRESTRRVIR
ncbi:LacI family DNA-binding transcriptional regulator [Ideonella sp. BN130291]|uniref:LacI family DNA-binding transcriptional regulator n=1 Tax=Ideonella sp. BN130291 TaxID=3112940 RepID=UPI002E26409F|nr:LacI family DNA-binding transcriptional regulator [Ideonella sp. BN130291]